MTLSTSHTENDVPLLVPYGGPVHTRSPFFAVTGTSGIPSNHFGSLSFSVIGFASAAIGGMGPSGRPPLGGALAEPTADGPAIVLADGFGVPEGFDTEVELDPVVLPPLSPQAARLRRPKRPRSARARMSAGYVGSSALSTRTVSRTAAGLPLAHPHVRMRCAEHVIVRVVRAMHCVGRDDALHALVRAEQTTPQRRFRGPTPRGC